MSLLIDDYPLIVLPALAEEIGLNEAIFLQQLNYWSQPKLNQGIVDEQGRRWIYNSVEAWRAQFRFFTERTLRRTISNLENLGLILSTLRYKRNPMDRTKSYAICQENVAALECSRNEKQAAAPKRSKPLFNVAPMPDGLTEEEAKGQSVECMWPKWPDAENQASEDFSSDSIKENAAKGQSVECMWPKWPDGSGQNGHMEEEAAKPDAARAEAVSSRAREETTTETTTEITAATAIDSDEEYARVREEIRTSLAAAEEEDVKYFQTCQKAGVPEESAKHFQRLFGRERVLEKLPILRDAQKRQRIENPAGWLRRALEGDYRRPALEKEQRHQARIRESAKARREAVQHDPHEAMSDEEIHDAIAALDKQIAAGEQEGAGEILATTARIAAKRKSTLLEVLEKRKTSPGTRASPEGG